MVIQIRKYSNLEQSKIYRTDQDGSIMFKIKNKELKIESCRQQKSVATCDTIMKGIKYELL